MTFIDSTFDNMHYCNTDYEFTLKQHIIMITIWKYLLLLKFVYLSNKSRSRNDVKINKATSKDNLKYVVVIGKQGC